MPNVKKKNEPQSDERRAAKPAEPHPETTRERVGEHAAAKKPRLTLPFSPDRSTAEQLLRFLLFVALGALTASAELLFGVRPFGLGLTAAATLPLLPAVAVGAAAFLLFTKQYVSLFALLLLLGLRAVVALFSPDEKGNRAWFAERPLYRVVAAAATALSIGVYLSARGGFRYYDLFALLLSVAAAPLSAALYLGIFEKKDKLYPYSREAGYATVILTAVFALRTVSFFGVYPAAAAAAGVAFLLVAHRGILIGSIGGALCGLCFDWRLAPAFFLCGLGFGLLEKSTRGGGVLAGSAAAALYAFFLDGTPGLSRLLPALLTAGALFLATDSAGLIEGAPAHRLAVLRKRAALQSAKADASEAGEARLREISGAFLDLSGTFYEVSSRLRRPALSDLRHLCDKAFDSVCPTCRHRDVCWGSEYNATAGTVGDISNRLHARGHVNREQLPADLTARCADLPRILAVINNGAATLAEEALHGDKTAVVAMDYAAVGRMISETLEETRQNYTPDAATGERLYDRLTRMGYTLESAAVCGREHRTVLLRGLRLPGRHINVRELRQIAERCCHFPLGDPALTPAEGASDVTFPERQRYAATTVKLTRAKGRGDRSRCGDTVATLSSERGYDYAFLCDGMGSGNAAALTSALASTFLSRLLSAGNRADTSLRMLNGFLSVRSRRESESSTTVDLLEIDRVSGEASLFKCGAAPTYLLRKGEITRFFSRTAPVGILESLDAERIRFHAEAGDVIVQVSDGFTAGEEECLWLAELLAERWDGDGENFARLAMGRAAGENGQDDLSIMITEVRPAPAPGAEEAAEAKPA